MISGRVRIKDTDSTISSAGRGAAIKVETLDSVYEVVRLNSAGEFFISSTIPDLYFITIIDSTTSYDVYDNPFDPSDTDILVEVSPKASTASSESNSATTLSDAESPEKTDSTQYLPQRPTYYAGSNAFAYVEGDDSDAPEIPISVFQWSADQNKNPVFPHASAHFANLMHGHYIVNGGFSLTNDQAFYFKERTGINFSPYMVNHNRFNLILEYRLPILLVPNMQSVERYRFIDVHISGMSHIVSADGQPVGETYEFIAKKVETRSLRLPIH